MVKCLSNISLILKHKLRSLPHGIEQRTSPFLMGSFFSTLSFYLCVSLAPLICLSVFFCPPTCSFGQSYSIRGFTKELIHTADSSSGKAEVLVWPYVGENETISQSSKMKAQKFIICSVLCLGSELIEQ